MAEKLSEYVSSIRYQDLTEDVVVEAKKRLIDSFGCAIGAFNAKPVRIAREVASRTKSSQSATILGTKLKTSPDLATFVNGIMVRYFDYNDAYLSKEPGHPSDNISACLAVGESERVSGKDVLLSVVLAYEIHCRSCDAANMRHRGWDHVCYGLVSSALAAGKLMGLTAEKLTQAVNIALNAHIAMRQVRAGELSDWKGCSFPNAARNAVFSTMLAREGMTGPSPIFEGEMGFFKQITGPFELNPKQFGGTGGSFKLLDTYLKFFPAEYHSQSAIWAAFEVRKQINNWDDVVSVEIDTHEASYTILAKDKEKWNPSTRETADHSLPYIVGMALLEGKIDNATYSERKFRDSKVLEFLKKITVREDKSLSDMYPTSVGNRVTVKLKSGELKSRQIDHPKGHPRNPMTSEEVERKFLQLTKKHLGEDRSRKVLKGLWDFEKIDDISTLMGRFA